MKAACYLCHTENTENTKNDKNFYTTLHQDLHAPQVKAECRNGNGRESSP